MTDAFLAARPDSWDLIWTHSVQQLPTLERAPAPEREPTNAPIFLAVMAVMLVGLSLIGSIT